MQNKTRQLTVTAMLIAIAYVVMVVGRIPVVLFLKYDPKDVIIAIGGFLYGPVTSLIIAIIVSLIEMFTVSDSGPIGALMNVIQSGVFTCTAAFIYKKKHDLKGAAMGLAAGWFLSTAIMMLWNYFITPIYMGLPREAVAELLLPAILPFNLLKGGLNAALTMLLYKPLVTVLRKSQLVPAIPNQTDEPVKKGKVNIASISISLLIAATCILFILVLQGRI